MKSESNPGMVSRIEEILKQNKKVLGEDFIQRTQKNLEPFREKESVSGMRETSEENIKVAVVGAFSCGKSTFINSILGDQVAPVEITPKTHGVTSFLFGEKETYDADGKTITREEYQEQVQDGENQVKHFIVNYPCERLKLLEFIDSPGFGSVSGKDEEVAKKDTALSEEAVNRADVVFFLTNITEGVIQGDALARLESICQQNENAVNPHRRIYVILTWADKKAPKERQNVQQSIQKLCSEHKLPVEGVLLYSSLPIEKFKSKSMQEFFSQARDGLFSILLDLQKFRVELLKYRQALKSQFRQVKLQSFLDSFQKDCAELIASQREIQTHAIQKKLEKEWKAFQEEVAECLSGVMKTKFVAVEEMLVWFDEEPRLFSSNRMEMKCDIDFAQLLRSDLNSIKEKISEIGEKYGYKISLDKKSPYANFLSDREEEKKLPLEGDELAYNMLTDYYSRPSSVDVFPLNSLRDYYTKFCVELVLSMGGPWAYYETIEKLYEIKNEKIQQLGHLIDSEASDYFSEMLASEMKPWLLEDAKKKALKSINSSIDKLQKAVDTLLENKDAEEEIKESSKEVQEPENASQDVSALCDIVLLDAGTKALKVAKVIAQLSGRAVDAVLEALEEPPCKVLEGVSEQEAATAKTQLEALGANVELNVKGGASAQPEQATPAVCDIVLLDVGSKALKVAKTISQLSGRELDAVLEALEDPPYKVLEGIALTEAESAKTQLEALGAAIDISMTLSPAPQKAAEQKRQLAEPEETFDVVLTNAGGKVIKVSKLLAPILNKGLDEVVENLEKLPMTIQKGLRKEEADSLQKQLSELGAEISLVSSKKPEKIMFELKYVDVVITQTGPQTMKLAQKISQETNGDFDEILEAVEELPFVVAKHITFAKGQSLKAALETLGATIELPQAKPEPNSPYSVILCEAGPNKKRVIEILEKLAEIPQEQSRVFLQNLPVMVSNEQSQRDALTLAEALTAVGASTKIQPPIQ